MLLLAAFIVSGWRFFQWAIVHAHWRGNTSDACPGDAGACWAFIVARWKPWLVGDYPIGPGVASLVLLHRVRAVLDLGCAALE